ncbi:dTDP-4-amino-4,6-dideoxygalactose transaminase [Desulfurobacterium pacificum]|uniref:dTDP-4-amino-4,6-dideoxygalactose transaminase n=1 Tax=Desulfurobacterium pacificum TaxID=240166 RepID=A0ABY1NMX4_9BACT|nr:DegT/DnrJ/EryC1/StrS family aminotransferase [Desulfurobacterium pacificum]SMP13986.1 dTDP-4-amino-4,6-dideoxygalactose transaminase [Desulfurobacterium pacificum]
MQKLLLDLNVVLDYLDVSRPRHKAVSDFMNRNKGKVKFLFASYHYDTLFYLVKRLKLEQEVIDKFLKDFDVNLVSTSGRNIIDAKSFKDIEDGILVSVCRRIGDDCYIITYDEEMIRNFERAVRPEVFKVEEPKTIPMLDLKLEYLSLSEDLEESLLRAATRARYILGDEVRQLEEKIANYVGTKYAVGVSSGTDALVLSLRALAIQRKKKEFFDKEDLVITTPFTFTATGEAILRAGATPLFVDIDIDTYNIDPKQIEKAVKKYGKRVKGIIPVHLYGQPCNMDEIMRIAKENDLFVVEDCAQSLGAKWNGKQTGSFGDMGCFSFFPTKPLGGFGDGGMITTNDEKLYELLLMLRKHGGRDKYNVEYIGYNARLDTIQAAVLLEKFKHLDDFNERRREIAMNYNEQLKDIEWIKTPYEHPKAYHVYHQYTVGVMNGKRDEFQKKLKEKGIQTMIYYPVPLYKMKVFAKNGMEVIGELENVQKVEKEVVSLPIEPLLGKEEIKSILNKVLNDS